MSLKVSERHFHKDKLKIIIDASLLSEKRRKALFRLISKRGEEL